MRDLVGRLLCSINFHKWHRHGKRLRYCERCGQWQRLESDNYRAEGWTAQGWEDIEEDDWEQSY